MPCLKAWPAGLPVLAGDACGVRELARDGDYGWGGDFSTVDKLSAWIAQVAAESPDQLARMGAAAPGHVRSGFSIEAMAAKYVRLYSVAARGNMSDLKVAADGMLCGGE